MLVDKYEWNNVSHDPSMWPHYVHERDGFSFQVQKHWDELCGEIWLLTVNSKGAVYLIWKRPTKELAFELIGEVMEMNLFLKRRFEPITNDISVPDSEISYT